MEDKKAMLIHEYEEIKDIPESFRFTEYVESYGTYMIKIGLNTEEIENRYSKALLLKARSDTSDVQGVMEVTLQHNLNDIAEYASKNIDTMLKDFMCRNEKVRRVGLKRNGTTIFLLKIRETDVLPENIDIPDDLENKNELINIRDEWFAKTVLIYKRKIEDETKRLLNIAGSKLSPKQERYNYARQLKRKIVSTSCLIDEDLEDFDFRQIVMNNYIFVNCNLKNANFSHVNLENTFFLNCNLEGTIFYGAQLNGCKTICGNETRVVDIFKKYT